MSVQTPQLDTLLQAAIGLWHTEVQPHNTTFCFFVIGLQSEWHVLRRLTVVDDGIFEAPDCHH